MKKQTAGRKNLGELAPKFAELNDDVLFGEVWAREDKLSARDRSLITIAALFSAGQFPQLKAHLQLGKEHGLKKQEIVEVFTQLAFYCGWPKAWSSFAMIEEVFGNEEENDKGLTDLFPIGDENVGYAKYFSGKSYLIRSRPPKSRCLTSPSSPGAGTPGISIMRKQAAGRCSSFCLAAAGTKKRENPQGR